MSTTANRGLRIIEKRTSPDGSSILRVAIRSAKDLDTYEVTVTARDDMEARIRWRHESGDPSRDYSVLIGGVGRHPLECSCPARKFRGQCCRHMQACQVLIRAGELEV